MCHLRVRQTFQWSNRSPLAAEVLHPSSSSCRSPSPSCKLGRSRPPRRVLLLACPHHLGVLLRRFLFGLFCGLVLVLGLRVFGCGWGCAARLCLQESARVSSAGDESARAKRMLREKSDRLLRWSRCCNLHGPFLHGPSCLYVHSLCNAFVCGVAGAPGCEWHRKEPSQGLAAPGGAAQRMGCVRMGWGPRTGS